MNRQSLFPPINAVIDLQRRIDRRLRELAEEPINAFANESRSAADTTAPASSLLPIEMRNHIAFRWLNTKHEFHEASALVTSQSPTQRSDLTLLRLLKWFVPLLTLRISSETTGWTPTGNTKAAKDAVVKKVESLVAAIESLEPDASTADTQELCASLRAFSERLSVPTKQTYGGPNALERYLLTQLAYALLGCLRYEPRSVVVLTGQLSAVLGFSPSHRTIQRYVRAAAGMTPRPLDSSVRKAKKSRRQKG